MQISGNANQKSALYVGNAFNMDQTTSFQSDGNVGIGELAPHSKFVVHGDVEFHGWRLNVNTNGNVGIGTGNPHYKLDVAGTAKACEFRVNLTGCDFVFEKGYKLRPLAEVEQFINTHKHLPEIAPAKEMETDDGVALGELNSKLLQKVEELTLYIIDLEKRMKDIEKKTNK
jgi:hypothetical protein